MALYDRKCPSCGEVIPQIQTPIWESSGFPCPACGRALKSSTLPIKLTLPITLTIAMSLCFYFGLRGPTAILISLVASIPLYFIVYAAVGLIFPPSLKLVSSKGDHPTSLIR